MKPFATPLRLAALLGFAVTLMTAASAQPAFEPAQTTLPDLRGHFSLAPADYDNDGDFDLLAIRTDADFLEQTSLTPVLYRNDGFDDEGVLQFVEVDFPAPSYPTQELGWDPMGETLAWSDYDVDGDVDVLVATPFGSTVYRNDGGAFTVAVELPRFSEGYASAFDARSAVWADADNDGDADLFLPESIDPKDPSVPDSSAVVLYLNDGGALTPAQTPSHYTRTGIQLSTGDVDGDGDVDLLYHDQGWNCSAHDFEPEEEECLVLFDNDGGTFGALPLDFPTVGTRGTSDLADIDGDGDLDLLIAGDVLSEDSTWAVGAYLFINDGGTFGEADTLDLSPAGGGTYGQVFGATLADYDSDGDVDVLLSGRLGDPPFESVAYVFANDGGAFTRIAEFSAAEYGPGAVVWADFDTDGDLDYLASGRGATVDSPLAYTTWLYRNEAPGANAPPTSPADLAAAPTGAGVELSWAPADDDHTATAALTYNLWVRDAEGRDVVSPMAGPEGHRLVPGSGNAGHHLGWSLTGLAPGAYTWTVQAVDNAFNAGAFAAEGSFTVGTVANESGTAPVRAALLGASPNPAQGSVRVRLDLPYAAEVGLRVYDVLGREVLVVPAQAVEAGVGREVRLDVRALPAGAYFYRVEVVRGGEADLLRGRLTLVR